MIEWEASLDGILASAAVDIVASDEFTAVGVRVRNAGTWQVGAARDGLALVAEVAGTWGAGERRAMLVVERAAHAVQAHRKAAVHGVLLGVA